MHNCGLKAFCLENCLFSSTHASPWVLTNYEYGCKEEQPMQIFEIFFMDARKRNGFSCLLIDKIGRSKIPDYKIESYNESSPNQVKQSEEKG